MAPLARAVDGGPTGRLLPSASSHGNTVGIVRFCSGIGSSLLVERQPRVRGVLAYGWQGAYEDWSSSQLLASDGHLP